MESGEVRTGWRAERDGGCHSGCPIQKVKGSTIDLIGEAEFGMAHEGISRIQLAGQIEGSS